MDIGRISAGYPDTTTTNRHADAPPAATDGNLQTGPPQVSISAGATAALSRILSRYDVTDITPGEFSEMIQKLFEAGAISDEELQQLASIRHDLEVDGMDPDDSLDLTDYYVQKIEKLQSRQEGTDVPPSPDEQFGPLLRRLDWIEKFALVQSSPDAFGIDAMV